MLEFLPIRSQNFESCRMDRIMSDVIIAGNKFTPEITFLVLYQTEYFAQKF